jgi:hypothetical protein
LIKLFSGLIVILMVMKEVICMGETKWVDFKSDGTPTDLGELSNPGVRTYSERLVGTIQAEESRRNGASSRSWEAFHTAQFQQWRPPPNPFAERELEAYQAYRSGDLSTARELWAKLAADGSVTSCFNLGRLYRQGEGVDQDLPRARALMEQAAQKGYPEGMRSLGIMMISGEGGPADCRQGVEWVERAARAGLPSAHLAMGWAYENALGVQQDPSKAYAWYTRAVKLGDPNAPQELSNLLAQLHTPRERRQARICAVELEAKATGKLLLLSRLRALFW